MCYFVTGYINDELYTEQFKTVCNRYGLMLDRMNNNLKCFDSGKTDCFRFTGDYCDCKTSFGTGKDKTSLQKYISFITELKSCKNAKYIALLKHWYSGSFNDMIEEGITVEEIHSNDIDADYLAGIKDDVLYKIYLYQKYY